jgi:hypothetical protein
MVGTKRTGHPHYTSGRGIEIERVRANSVTNTAAYPQQCAGFGPFGQALVQTP